MYSSNRFVFDLREMGHFPVTLFTTFPAQRLLHLYMHSPRVWTQITFSTDSLVSSPSWILSYSLGFNWEADTTSSSNGPTNNRLINRNARWTWWNVMFWFFTECGACRVTMQSARFQVPPIRLAHFSATSLIVFTCFEKFLPRIYCVAPPDAASSLVAQRCWFLLRSSIIFIPFSSSRSRPVGDQMSFCTFCVNDMYISIHKVHQKKVSRFSFGDATVKCNSKLQFRNQIEANYSLRLFVSRPF